MSLKFHFPWEISPYWHTSRKWAWSKDCKVAPSRTTQTCCSCTRSRVGLETLMEVSPLTRLWWGRSWCAWPPPGWGWGCPLPPSCSPSSSPPPPPPAPPPLRFQRHLPPWKRFWKPFRFTVIRLFSPPRQNWAVDSSPQDLVGSIFELQSFYPPAIKNLLKEMWIYYTNIRFPIHVDKRSRWV